MIDLTLSASSGKPPLGGWLPGLDFTARQAAVLNAAADQLIPGGEGFPAPSAVGVVAFIGRYVTPAALEAKWYPFIGEEDFRSHLDALGDPFLGSSPEQQVKVLEGLELDDSEFFTKLRDIVYHAYYSRSEVVAAINTNLAAGEDYRQSPQPFGYSDTIKDWDDELLARVRGTYKRTEDVVRLALPDNLAGPGEKALKTDNFPSEPGNTTTETVRLLESGIGAPPSDYSMS